MLELDGVGFHYPRADWVFRNVSLEVPPGCVTAVMGPNGRGKSTLLRCAAGLLSPQEGTVRVHGPVGFVPQAHGTAFAYRAIDMVVMGRVRQIGWFSTPGSDDWVAAHDAMERIGIAHLRDRRFPQLSGGEQQLVLVARALASESAVLLLDEPTTGLDLHNQVRILSLLRKLAADGLALLVSTHHPDHALYLATSVVLLDGSGTAVSGPANRLLDDRTLSDLYGIDVAAVTYPDGNTMRRAIVTRYE
ncbi:MAG: ABC transporter ATP-binding protein [Nocardioides sp.]|nr:ABC transporter ATP-binding protein [Nocardioides sp.]